MKNYAVETPKNGTLYIHAASRDQAARIVTGKSESTAKRLGLIGSIREMNVNGKGGERYEAC